jgi:single-stranded-DNA-specific exonuclease
VLSLLNKRWVYKSSAPVLDIPTLDPVVVQVLMNRGVDSLDKIQAFLKPSLQRLSPLENIPQILPAAQFVLAAIAAGKKITVYGDYDVDGLTGTTLLMTAFRELGAKHLTAYIPHRFNEGYGLNGAAIRKLQAEGTELLVTVDCGISNYAEIKLAKELGLQVVITDHHMPPVVLPEADYVINPKLNNSAFAARNLSGVGVAFKLIEQMFRLQGAEPYAQTRKYLDLVVLGTIADIVPLLEDNRIFAVEGLKQLNLRLRTGLRALADICVLGEKEIEVKDVGFGLAPRLNAAGRLDSSLLSLNLLMEKDYPAARALAMKLNELNNQRQEIGQKIKEQVIAEIERIPHKETEKVFILSSPGWHPGILGIVASQIVKLYNRPTALISDNAQDSRGSIRSVEGIDIFEPLSSCGFLLKDFGGHKEAAGFEIDSARIDEFKAKFTRAIEESIGLENLIATLAIEMPLKKEQITLSLAQGFMALAPFGQNNPMPIFTTQELSLYDYRVIGNGDHLKFSFTDGERIIDGVGFGMGSLYQTLRSVKKVEIAFNLGVNTWQGKTSLQLIVKDIRAY